MISQNRRLLNFAAALTDAVIIVISYLFSTWFYLTLQHTKGNMAWKFAGQQIWVAIAYAVVLVMMYWFSHLYVSEGQLRTSSACVRVCEINLLGVLVLAALFFLVRWVNFSRGVLACFYITSSLLVVLRRIVQRLVEIDLRKKGVGQKNVVVVGNGALASKYIQTVNNNLNYGFKVLGYVSAVEKQELGSCLGTYEQLETVLSANPEAEVVVALEPHENQFMRGVIDACEKEGARVSIIPFYNDYIPARPSIDLVGSSKLINIRTTPLDNVFNAFVKRGMDVVGSLLLIVLSSPIMLLVAIGVKLSSPGPILFKQDRVGKNKKNFKMLKFRSMRVNAQQQTGWSKDVDPRKTKFGSFIRKFSLDELPQFFNVLVGDMSLIGPRPEVPFHVNHFKDEIPLYLVRQQVRPGITGWAQVNGLRGNTSIKMRVEHDIWYIENWSIGLDMLILFKTAFGGMVNSEKLQTGETSKN